MEGSCRIAISTAWNAYRHTSGAEMVEELLDLGFDALELNVHVTPEMIREVADMVDEGRVRVCALHNYCPVPPGIDRERAAGNILPLSEPDERGRRAAVGQAKETVDWANRLGAGAVVLHLGLVPMETRQREALRLIREGKSEEARALVMEDLMDRAMKRRPYIDAAAASMGELAEHAEGAGVNLGLETRYYYHEIPTLDEFQNLFKNIRSSSLGYWHDTGHAHVMEVLGIASHEDFLRKYSSKLFGVHLHDAVVGSDHRALGRGEIDFAPIVSYMKEDTIVVLEVHRQASAEDLLNSRDEALRLLENTKEVV